MTSQEFLDRLKVAPGVVKSYRHGNESGILWEKLWKYDGQKFWSKVCASGCFVDWQESEEAVALRHIERDFVLMRESHQISKR